MLQTNHQNLPLLPAPKPVHFLPRALGALMVFALFVVTPFLAAGTFDWPEGTLYVVLFIAAGVLSRVAVALRFPDLLRERARYTEMQDAKPWDRWLMPLVGMIGPLATLIVAGLDRRYAWSAPFEQNVITLAFIAIGLGFALAVWAMIVNKFFATLVRIQTERGHQVVTDGPYQIVRHPSYTGGVFAHLATPFALGSWWALIPALVTVAGLIARTALEDRTLLRELRGYRAYAERTRSRLIPGVW
jgi:protein-S-isoprenylcysteine O-methyltransferase Ste14